MQGLGQIKVDKKEERKENHAQSWPNSHTLAQFPPPFVPLLGLARLFPSLLPQAQPALFFSFKPQPAVSRDLPIFLSPFS